MRRRQTASLHRAKLFEMAALAAARIETLGIRPFDIRRRRRILKGRLEAQ